MAYFVKWLPFFQESLMLCMEYGWPSLLINCANRIQRMYVERRSLSGN